MAKPTVIMLRETWQESWVRDASALALFVGLIGIGVLLDSAAMQWTGALVAFLSVLAFSGRHRVHLTIEQARAKLDEIEARA